jgi:ribosomal protein S18 acetylase RimI-like enzyme
LSDFAISVETDRSKELSRFLFDTLNRSNVERTSDGTSESVCVVARDNTNALVGGVYGEVYWGWFHVLVLWVAPSLRCRGVGAHLLARAETEAHAKGCHGAWLDTFTFQAASFYRRAGYEIFGTLEQYPNGHSRNFLRKQLRGSAA